MKRLAREPGSSPAGHVYPVKLSLPLTAGSCLETKQISLQLYILGGQTRPLKRVQHIIEGVDLNELLQLAALNKVDEICNPEVGDDMHRRSHSEGHTAG